MQAQKLQLWERFCRTQKRITNKKNSSNNAISKKNKRLGNISAKIKRLDREMSVYQVDQALRQRFQAIPLATTVATRMPTAQITNNQPTQQPSPRFESEQASSAHRRRVHRGQHPSPMSRHACTQTARRQGREALCQERSAWMQHGLKKMIAHQKTSPQVRFQVILQATTARKPTTWSTSDHRVQHPRPEYRELCDLPIGLRTRKQGVWT